MDTNNKEEAGNTKKRIYVGLSKDICVICGAEVPEGREVCPICEIDILDGMRETT